MSCEVLHPFNPCLKSVDSSMTVAVILGLSNEYPYALALLRRLARTEPLSHQPSAISRQPSRPCLTTHD